jgi:hypothetical protein
LLVERGADPSIRGEMFPFDAAGLLAILSAVDGRDPVIRQLHELLKPRSAELPPQVPSRRSPSAGRTTGAARPVPQPAIRHEIHEAFMTSPPPSSAGDTSSADHSLGLISAQIRPPRRVNTQVKELHAVRACEGVTSRVAVRRWRGCRASESGDHADLNVVTGPRLERRGGRLLPCRTGRPVSDSTQGRPPTDARICR